MSSNFTIQQTPDPNDGKVVSDEAFFYFKVVNIVVLTLVFNVLGTITNVINMIVFVRIGFSETINISFMALAISDFGSCFLLIWRSIALNPWFQEIENLPFDPNAMMYLTSAWPHVFCARVTTLLTALISLERCFCVTMPLKVKLIITKKRVIFINVSCYIVVALSALPLYLTNYYGPKFYPDLNRTLIGLLRTGNSEVIEIIQYSILNVLLTVIPFIIISISTAFLVVSLNKNTKWKQSTNVTNNDKVSTKENKVVKMVTTVSSLFIICLFPHIVALVLILLDPEQTIDGKRKNLMITIGSFVFLLESVNSSCNIFIYYSNSSVYKSNLKQIFGFGRKKGDE